MRDRRGGDSFVGYWGVGGGTDLDVGGAGANLEGCAGGGGAGFGARGEADVHRD